MAPESPPASPTKCSEADESATRTPEERRQVIAAIGPLWTWHEVWLLGFGGTLIAIFPRLMASAFAGYYLALFLILWCLILRGISLEVGGHINDRLWQGYWDFNFVLSNFLLAILFGAAAGNVARGVPVDAQGNFSMAFFTNFNVRGHVGLLDWYTVSIAILAVVMLAAHGATYLTLKTEGLVRDRWGKIGGESVDRGCPLFLVVLIQSRIVRPDLPGRALSNPFWWIGLAVIADFNYRAYIWPEWSPRTASIFSHRIFLSLASWLPERSQFFR